MTAIGLLLGFHFLISWIALSLCIVITRPGDLSHKLLHRSILENRRMKVHMETILCVCVHVCVYLPCENMETRGWYCIFSLTNWSYFFILKWRFSLNLGAHHVCQIRWAMSSKVCSSLSCGHTDVYFSAWLLTVGDANSGHHVGMASSWLTVPSPQPQGYVLSDILSPELALSLVQFFIIGFRMQSAWVFWVKESKIAKCDYSLGLLHHHAIYTGLLLERKRRKCFLCCHDEWWSEACDEPFPGKIISFVSRMSRHFLGHQIGKRTSPKANILDYFSDLQIVVGSAGTRRALVLRWGVLCASLYFS